MSCRRVSGVVRSPWTLSVDMRKKERSGLIIQNPGFLETPHRGTDRFTASSKDIPRLYPPRGRLLSRPPCLIA